MNSVSMQNSEVDQTILKVVIEQSPTLKSQFTIYVGSVRVGVLSRWETLFRAKEFRVSAGKHPVYISAADKVSDTIEIDFKPYETVFLITGLPGLHQFLGLRPYLRRKQVVEWKAVGEKIANMPSEAFSIGQRVANSFKSTELSNITTENNTVIFPGDKSQQIPRIVDLEPDLEEVQAAAEEVSIPSGVSINVKRSRTIEHTVEIEQGNFVSGSLNLGIPDILGTTIRAEIEKRQGRSYRESEMIEYDVSLDGKVSEHYRLVWIDLWRKGVAEVTSNNCTVMVPSLMRKGTVLHVTHQ
ncbi:hypothetical protein [Adonisia turfae]|nr:hypothetical protein [Adonisia turfae]